MVKATIKPELARQIMKISALEKMDFSNALDWVIMEGVKVVQADLIKRLPVDKPVNR